MSFTPITREKLHDLYSVVSHMLDARGSSLSARERVDLLHRFFSGADELQVAHFNRYQAFSPDRLVDVSKENSRPDLMVCEHFGLTPVAVEYAKTRGYSARDSDSPDTISALNLFWNVAVGNIPDVPQGAPSRGAVSAAL